MKRILSWIYLPTMLLGLWLLLNDSLSPGFIKIPITMKDPHGLAALSCIVTYTPGTAWAEFAEEEELLTLHVLDLRDEDYWIHKIQDDYERPLREIFE